MKKKTESLMIAHISTYLPCSENKLWSKIMDPESLQFVASPVLRFIPVVNNDFNQEWEENRDYVLKLYLFGFLPLGNHTIRLLNIDRSENKLESTESGLLARVWNHTILFRNTGDNRVYYTDIIEIKAGLLTPIIWCFAHLFYRHRQRRWKKLLKL
jgi:hypothetical protein